MAGITIFTAQMAVPDDDALDITVGTKDKAGKVLAPTWELVGGHKAHNGHEKFVGKHEPLDDDQYTAQYKALLRERWKENRQAFINLVKRDRLVLKCYCRPGAFCHRHIALDVLDRVAQSEGIEVTRGGELLHMDYTRRADAVGWAKQIIQSGNNVVYLDTETTGSDPIHDEPVSIAIIDHTGQRLLNRRIKPTVPIHPEAEAVHGISDKMVENSPSFADIIDDLNRVLRGKLVVIYNQAFDENIMLKTAERQGVTLDWHRASCAQTAFARFFGHYSAYYKKFIPKKLSEACDVLDVPVVDAHDALADAVMTYELVKALARQTVPDNKPPTLL